MAAPQEFVIRASGADKAATKHLVARFPLAFRPDPRSDETANAPELKGTGEWAMGQMEQAEARPGTRGWVLLYCCCPDGLPLCNQRVTTWACRVQPACSMLLGQ